MSINAPAAASGRGGGEHPRQVDGERGAVIVQRTAGEPGDRMREREAEVERCRRAGRFEEPAQPEVLARGQREGVGLLVRESLGRRLDHDSAAAAQAPA
jgi:hypothetical protein